MHDLRKWRHAVVLADTGTFAKASRALRLTQPALTRSIQALETQIGIMLFDRLPNGILVTGAGKELLEHARFLLSQASGLQKHANELRTGESGTVAFGVVPMLAPLLLDLVDTWMREFWNTDLNVYIQPVPRMTDLLLKDALDFFVGDTRGAVLDGRFEVSNIITLDVGHYVRADHPLLAEKAVSAEDLLRYPQVAPNFPSDGGVKGMGTRRGRIICEDVSILKRAVLAGDAILLGMAPALEPELSEGRIARLAVNSGSEMVSEVGVVSLPRVKSVTAQRIIEHINMALPSMTPCAEFGSGA